jgi:hypothetical protein
MVTSYVDRLDTTDFTDNQTRDKSIEKDTFSTEKVAVHSTKRITKCIFGILCKQNLSTFQVSHQCHCQCLGLHGLLIWRSSSRWCHEADRRRKDAKEANGTHRSWNRIREWEGGCTAHAKELALALDKYFWRLDAPGAAWQAKLQAELVLLDETNWLRLLVRCKATGAGDAQAFLLPVAPDQNVIHVERVEAANEGTVDALRHGCKIGLT